MATKGYIRGKKFMALAAHAATLVNEGWDLHEVVEILHGHGLRRPDGGAFTENYMLSVLWRWKYIYKMPVRAGFKTSKGVPCMMIEEPRHWKRPTKAERPAPSRFEIPWWGWGIAVSCAAAGIAAIVRYTGGI